MATIPKLPALVRDTFKAAQKAGDLTFYQTQVSILQCNGLPFQVRFSQALASKPKLNKPADPKDKPFDPFTNPQKGLLISDFSFPSHVLILNKFPIIPNHFILATKEFKEQTDLLEEDDLEAAYACLDAYREIGEELFGFFNSGEHSGYSQAHRHIQFLPVEAMRSGIEADENWTVLADSLIKTPRPDLPFAYFSTALPQNPSPRLLHETYTALHDSACSTVQAVAGNLSSASNLQSPIGYNLAFTDRVMVLCPRASDGVEIKNSSGEPIGVVSLNGSLLGGTILAKSEAEFHALRNNESMLRDVLRAIGFPPNKIDHDERL